jgi:hypothetical protein
MGLPPGTALPPAGQRSARAQPRPGRAGHTGRPRLGSTRRPARRAVHPHRHVARAAARDDAGRMGPWLFDTVHPRRHNLQDIFDTYVRGNSVLLAPRSGGGHVVAHHRQTWPGPWMPFRAPRRACPACAAEPDHGEALIWRLALTAGCLEHGYHLEDATSVAVAIALGDPPDPVLVGEPLATLDRYVLAALTTGRVQLPGRTVHAGVWFRLLRSLLDEVSIAATSISVHARTTLGRVWDAAGRPPRGGLTSWQPYENLTPEMQQAMRHAAATAIPARRRRPDHRPRRPRLGAAPAAPPRLRRRPASAVPHGLARPRRRGEERNRAGPHQTRRRPAAP